MEKSTFAAVLAAFLYLVTTPIGAAELKRAITTPTGSSAPDLVPGGDKTDPANVDAQGETDSTLPNTNGAGETKKKKKLKADGQREGADMVPHTVTPD